VTGLRSDPVAAIQQAPARHPQLGGDCPGEQLGLVVPAPARPSAAGGRPRDHVDRTDPHAPNHQAGQLPGDLATVAVLQPVHHLAGNPFERQRCDDAGIADLRRSGGERETATMTERLAGLIAAGAECGEEHGGIGTRGV